MQKILKVALFLQAICTIASASTISAIPRARMPAGRSYTFVMSPSGNAKRYYNPSINSDVKASIPNALMDIVVSNQMYDNAEAYELTVEMPECMNRLISATYYIDANPYLSQLTPNSAQANRQHHASLDKERVEKKKLAKKEFVSIEARCDPKDLCERNDDRTVDVMLAADYDQCRVKTLGFSRLSHDKVKFSLFNTFSPLNNFAGTQGIVKIVQENEKAFNIEYIVDMVTGRSGVPPEQMRCSLSNDPTMYTEMWCDLLTFKYVSSLPWYSPRRIVDLFKKKSVDVCFDGEMTRIEEHKNKFKRSPLKVKTRQRIMEAEFSPLIKESITPLYMLGDWAMTMRWGLDLKYDDIVTMLFYMHSMRLLTAFPQMPKNDELKKQRKK